MNNLEFTIFAEPFSINKAYYLKSYSGKSATKIRTKECREWGDRVIDQLQKYKKEMELFRDGFNEKQHALHIELDFCIPVSKFYTKTGHISIASSDITNIEKLLVDLLFDERFNGRSLNSQIVENININDKFITKMVSSKSPSNREYKICIKIQKVLKPTIKG
jgi:hypothetical protein